MKTGRRIAIIERSERIREVLARRLRESGYTHVLEAETPEAFAGLFPPEAGGGPVDLAVVDVEHGGVADPDLLEALRRLEPFRESRLLALTGRKGLAAVDAALSGVGAVLAKPFCASLFADTVDELLDETDAHAPARAAACAPGSGGELLGDEGAHPDPDRALTTVLVVDDSASMRHVVRQLLSRLGFERFESASNFREAEAVLRSRPVGLVLSDLRMPGRSGLDLLDMVRADPDLARTPFVLVSSESTMENVFQAGRHGASGFLPKPFTEAALERAVARAMAEP